MPKKKSKYKLRINGLDIEVISEKGLIIYDKMHNVDNEEALKICAYLVREGFLETEGEHDFAVQIIHP
tara:strand:+ start:2479 stop:2682 length:204 start_codon:yes stop_codon:yes gene_type:complete